MRRIARKKIQQHIDLLQAFLDGGEIEIGGMRIDGIIDADTEDLGWQPCRSVYIDLYQKAPIQYEYRIKPNDTSSG